MQNTTQTNQPICYNEDEIDLREIFKTIARNKKVIIIITFTITALAIIYALFKTPIYEAKAVMEIGFYKINNSTPTNQNAKVTIHNPRQLSTKLTILFIDKYENDKNPNKISVISIPKKANNFISITAQGLNNNQASQKISQVLQYVQAQDKEILDDVIKQHKLELKNVLNEIDNIKNKETFFLDQKIKLIESSLRKYEKKVRFIEENIKKTSKKNPSLAALEIMQKKMLLESIISFNNQLIDLQSKKDYLINVKLGKFIEKKEKLEALLEPYNYKASHLVGDILTKDYPVKPKKKLIIAIAFISGIIISIFLVFFLEFLRSMRESETSDA